MLNILGKRFNPLIILPQKIEIIKKSLANIVLQNIWLVLNGLGGLDCQPKPTKIMKYFMAAQRKSAV